MVVKKAKNGQVKQNEKRVKREERAQERGGNERKRRRMGWERRMVKRVAAHRSSPSTGCTGIGCHWWFETRIKNGSLWEKAPGTCDPRSCILPGISLLGLISQSRMIRG